MNDQFVQMRCNAIGGNKFVSELLYRTDKRLQNLLLKKEKENDYCSFLNFLFSAEGFSFTASGEIIRRCSSIM